LKLADLLRGRHIAECYIPDKKTMDLRELVRHIQKNRYHLYNPFVSRI